MLGKIILAGLAYLVWKGTRCPVIKYCMKLVHTTSHVKNETQIAFFGHKYFHMTRKGLGAANTWHGGWVGLETVLHFGTCRKINPLLKSISDRPNQRSENKVRVQSITWHGKPMNKVDNQTLNNVSGFPDCKLQPLITPMVTVFLRGPPAVALAPLHIPLCTHPHDLILGRRSLMWRLTIKSLRVAGVVVEGWGGGRGVGR